MKRITLCSLFLFCMSSIVGQEIGLQLYSLRNQMKDDVEGMLAKINKWGITKIEDGNDGTYDYSFEEYKALLEKNNLEMVSISAPFDELKNSPGKCFGIERRHMGLNMLFVFGYRMTEIVLH